MVVLYIILETKTLSDALWHWYVLELCFRHLSLSNVHPSVTFQHLQYRRRARTICTACNVVTSSCRGHVDESAIRLCLNRLSVLKLMRSATTFCRRQLKTVLLQSGKQTNDCSVMRPRSPSIGSAI